MPSASLVRALYAVAAFPLACAHGSADPIGVTRHDEIPEPITPAEDSGPEPKRRVVPDDIVARSELPFSILQLDGMLEVAETELLDALGAADLVCLGEEHDNPHHHFAQLYLVQELAGRASLSGRRLGLGLEMFEAPFQEHLDQYAAGQLGDAALLERTEYEERWGWPFAYYRPQIDHAATRGAALLALNADKETVRAVAREGLEWIDDETFSDLGGVDLENEEHQALFDALMQGHPEGEVLTHAYEAQVLWDETMASTASAWLAEAYPARQLIVLAGSAHCHHSAIPDRSVQRFPDIRAVSVLLAVAAEPDELRAHRALDGYDYAFVMHPER